jgi:hypothetical protein
VKVVDANVLLYAVNSDAERHEQARSWLDSTLSGRGVVGFSWIALLAFIRLSTKPGLFPSPLSTQDAMDRVREWLAPGNAVLLESTDRHIDVLAGLLGSVGTSGNLINDAHLAALAIEHGGEVISYDHDFGRFPGLRWSPPQ